MLTPCSPYLSIYLVCAWYLGPRGMSPRVGRPGLSVSVPEVVGGGFRFPAWR